MHNLPLRDVGKLLQQFQSFVRSIISHSRQYTFDSVSGCTTAYLAVKRIFKACQRQKCFCRAVAAQVKTSWLPILAKAYSQSQHEHDATVEQGLNLPSTPSRVHACALRGLEPLRHPLKSVPTLLPGRLYVCLCNA